MFAVVNEAGEVFHGEGSTPGLFEVRAEAEAVAAWFWSVYGPLQVEECGWYEYGYTRARVAIHGRRGGFVYVTFREGPHKGAVTKVPSSWVDTTKPEEP